MALMRMAPAALAALALLLPPGAAHAVTPLQKQRIGEIARTLRAEGPKKVLERYFKLENSDPELHPGPGYALVETGDPGAVKLGVALLDVSDAGLTESLLSSLASALAKNPRAVLPYVGQSALLSPEKICIPLLPLDGPQAGAKARAALDRAEMALAAVHEKAFAKSKDACLKAIAQYREGMRRGRASADVRR